MARDAEAAPFANRQEAGRDLARLLAGYANRKDVVVLGVPRGGVPVAAEVARSLGAPLDVFIVRKLGLPGHRELAMGAIASGGVRLVNPDVASGFAISGEAVEAVAAEEARELARREHLYRAGRPPLSLKGRVVILVDDGLATGSSLLAAVQGVRQLRPARVVVAVPVGSPDACRKIEQVADEMVCVRIPRHFAAVGQWYVDFSETTDEIVQALLAAPAGNPPHPGEHVQTP